MTFYFYSTFSFYLKAYVDTPDTYYRILSELMCTLQIHSQHNSLMLTGMGTSTKEHTVGFNKQEECKLLSHPSCQSWLKSFTEPAVSENSVC